MDPLLALLNASAPQGAPDSAPNEAHDATAPQSTSNEAHEAHDAPQATIPPLPLSPGFQTYDDAYNFIQGFLRENGAAVVKRSSSNKRDINGIALATRVLFICDRGPQRASTSVGLRKSSTQKIDCPFRILVTASRTEEAWKWDFCVTEAYHNHGPSLDPSAHNIHRRRTVTQQALERNLSKHKALPAREMSTILRDAEPDAAFFRSKDIYNDRQKLRFEALGGKTATQAFIGHLQAAGLPHYIKFDPCDENKVQGVLWTYPWCVKMWKRFPEVLGLDNTYKTNRFKLYLFQVTGVTDQKSLANFAFGLINTEKEEGFQWLCESLDAIRAKIGAPEPSVVITDKEAALKNALLSVFPSSQQQLCIYHINSNIRARIWSRWKDPANPDGVENPANDDMTIEVEAILAREATDPEAAAAAYGPDDEIEYSRDGMLAAWKRVIYANKEEDFYKAWQQLDQTFGQRQGHIVTYISNEYMPWREQWAQCFISRYRNFGQRVNSPVETAHKDVKSYLVTGTSDLLHLHDALIQMIENKERSYIQTAAQQQIRQRRLFLGQSSWLGDLNVTVTYQAIDLIAQQHRRAKAAIPSSTRELQPLDPCSGRFTGQLGLPCAHTILQRLQAGLKLGKHDVLPRWWLEKPLVRPPLFFLYI